MADFRSDLVEKHPLEHWIKVAQKNDQFIYDFVKKIPGI